MSTAVPEAPSRAYSVAEAAERSTLGQSTIRRMIAEGRLEARHLGRRVVIPEPALARLVNGQG